MNEKVYKTMTKTGGFSIAMGIVSVVVGLVVGIGCIVSGALLSILGNFRPDQCRCESFRKRGSVHALWFSASDVSGQPSEMVSDNRLKPAVQFIH